MHIKATLRFYLTPVKMGSSGIQMTMNSALDVANGNPYTPLVGVQTIAATLGMSLEVLQKYRKWFTVRTHYTTPAHIPSGLYILL